MSRPPFRSFVEVSRERIASNYRSLCAAVAPGAEVMAVVKADAYGHGAVEVSRVLLAQGVRWLAVSSVDEGCVLRTNGIEARVLVMGGYLPFEREAFFEYDLTPVVHSLEELAAMDDLARRTGRPLPVHLKIDTGMSRLGVREPVERIVDAVSALRHAKLEGLMTHFASAADYGSPQTANQAQRFHTVLEALRASGHAPPVVHMSSTNAIGYGRREAWHNLVRAGHALYGYLSPARGPAPEPLLQVKPALTWKARLVAVKEIEPGALVGYGGTFCAPRAMRIGIVAAGYADGVFHKLSNRGRVIAAGKLTPILGTVSMDLTIVDLSHTTALAPGDEVTLLGREGDVSLDAMQIARLAGTISYNILCGISARVRRVYV